eukprot:gene6484-11938_t
MAQSVHGVKLLLPTAVWKPRYACSDSTHNGNATLDNERRFNEINIQMLSKTIHQQIFSDSDSIAGNEEVFSRIKEHLTAHGLWGKDCTVIDDIKLQLPKFDGKNISEHFENIARNQSQDYMHLAKKIASSQPPPMPQSWLFETGWTKYEKDGSTKKVSCPEDSAFVFDVEVCINENDLPVMATAASEDAWYCWLSDALINKESSHQYTQRKQPNFFIPLENRENKEIDKKLVIGHNVGFDRSYVKEQYFLEKSQVMFLDTLSMHMCISGLTGIQRILINSKKAKKADWMDIGSLNNLVDVYALYTNNGVLSKTIKDLFVEGTLADIRDNFQECVGYCAKDVQATFEVFTNMWPEFLNHVPHPVTFAGMLEMGTSYLPIDDSWERYIKDSNEAYDDLENETKTILMKLAEDSCRLIHNKRYQKDPWLWSLDWSVQDLSLKKEKPKKKARKSSKGTAKDELKASEEPCKISRIKTLAVDELLEEDISDWYPDLPLADDVLYKRRQHMVGFPSWYRKLCPKMSDPEWEAGPSLVSPQTRYAPILLRLTWDGFPLFFSGKYGWGYLVPDRHDNLDSPPYDPPPSQTAKKKKGAVLVGPDALDLDEPGENVLAKDSVFPTESFCEAPFRQRVGTAHIESLSDEEIMKLDEEEIRSLEEGSSTRDCSMHDGIGPFNEVNLPGVWFYKMPHKNGEQFRCGNPLGKDYLSKLEDGTLASSGGHNATRTLQNNKMISFWRNAQKRICSQMTVHLNDNEINETMKCHKDYDPDNHYGAILPKVITAGTVTRRAVEITWLTASNPRADRVGSELKAMVRSPPGYCFVGADVDSQELWIASILGDAKFAGIHGCTAFGWMTLQGKKSDGTDLHSKTANTIKISRDDAKILNYGRIYGAGQRYARQLLMQFNHRLTEEMAMEKAAQLYKTTKGSISYELSSFGKELANKHGIPFSDDGFLDSTALKTILRRSRIPRGRERQVAIRRWTKGSESEMFNMLEDIAVSEEPRTPVLQCKISRSLDPGVVKDEFITSRLNWVVQSSAVDYLHLILVCMKWLFAEFNIQGRFCISIHDEVRYIVKEKDRYRAALALQITNLFTRAMFAYKLGMNDLPQASNCDTCNFAAPKD